MRTAFLLAAALVTWSAGHAAPRSSSPADHAAAGAGKVYLTVPEALELAFGDCAVERGTVFLKGEQKQRVRELSGVELERGIVYPYVGLRDGQIVGTAYFDTHRVRTMRETLMFVVSPEGKIARIEMLAFAEPQDYIPRGNWYGQFLGRRLDDELTLKRGIRGVSGATLTARATTSAARRVLATHLVLQEPPRDPRGEGERE